MDEEAKPAGQNAAPGAKGVLTIIWLGGAGGVGQNMQVLRPNRNYRLNPLILCKTLDKEWLVGC